MTMVGENNSLKTVTIRSGESIFIFLSFINIKKQTHPTTCVSVNIEIKMRRN